MPPDHAPDHDHSHDHGSHAHGHSHSHSHGTEEPPDPRGRPLRIGVGGPVGSGKTALVAALCRELAGEVSMVVVTNELSGTVTTYEVVHSPGACGEDEIAAGF